MNIQERAAASSAWILNDLYGTISQYKIEPQDVNEHLLILAQLALLCASSDLLLSHEERKWLINCYAAMNASDEIISYISHFTPPNKDEMASEFSLTISKLKDHIENISAAIKYEHVIRNMIYFITQMSRADGEVTQAEKEAIYKLANELEVDRTTVDSFMQIIEEQYALRQKRFNAVFV